MKIHNESIVSYETAKLLKEAGFNDTCRAFWKVWNGKTNLYNCDKGQCFDYCCNNMFEMYNDSAEENVAAPTLQMAMKWLRKEHNLCIVPLPVVTDDDGEGGCLWKYTISMKLKVLFDSGNLYESPEVALDDAIKYCLENLI